MKNLYAVLFLVLLMGQEYQAQVDNQTAFRFISNPAVSRVSAMGGVVNSIMDDDLGLPYGNPALLNPQMDNQAIFSYNAFLATSGYGYFSYARDYENIATFSANVMYMDYGNFAETDISGQQIGEFKAKETALNLAGSRMVGERLRAGAQVRFLFSNLERYSSFGMGLDLGLSYHIEEEFLTTSLVFRNMGSQFTSYHDSDNKLPLPFNIQFGVTKKMKHAPFRLGLVLDNLQQWDLSYTDPNLIGKRDPLTGEPVEIKPTTFGDKLMRHVIFSGEIVIGDSFGLQLAYNYRRRKELSVSDRPGISGLSFGFNIAIKSLDLSYALSNYTQAGSTHHFTLGLRFNDMRKEKALN